MRRIMAAAVGVSATALLATAAQAAPAFLPQRDVAVTYALDVPNQSPMSFRLLYAADDRRGRVENLTQGYAVLVDLAAGRAVVVLPSLHALVKAPDFSALTGQIANADGARFTPEGAGSYAGLGCERYHVQNDQGQAQACITRDGVVLHFAGHDAHGSAEVTAQAVDYRPIGPQDVAPPIGYSEISLPPGLLMSMLNPH
jgi:hypothetical protein